MVALPDLIIAEAVVASGGASGPDSAPRHHPQLLFYQRRARRRTLTLRTYHAGVCRGVASGGHVRGKTARVPGCIRLAGNRDCPCDGAYGIPSRGASAGHPLCDQRLLLFPSSTPNGLALLPHAARALTEPGSHRRARWPSTDCAPWSGFSLVFLTCLLLLSPAVSPTARQMCSPRAAGHWSQSRQHTLVQGKSLAK